MLIFNMDIQNNKELFKLKLKDFLKIISFILVFLMLLEMVSLLFFSSKQATGFKNKMKDAYSFVDEPDNTIQVVCLGNSNIYSAFCPFVLWYEFGYTSTVCASAMQSIQESQYLLERMLENQKPQVVIIETDMFYDHKPDQVNSDLKKNKKIDNILNAAKPEYFEKDIENVFTIFKFHNKWKAGNQKEVKSQFNYHGYRYNNKIVKLSKSDYMKPTNSSEEISDINIKQMNSLINLCKKKNLQVVLVDVPSISSWNFERHNAVMEYAKKNNIPFLDLNLCYDEMNISMTTCFRDKGTHVNFTGANAITKYIGNYIKKNYNIDSLTNDKSYEVWNKNYAAFIKETNKISL